MSKTMTVDGVVAKIEGGALGDGYSVKVEDRSADGYDSAKIYVIRHGRQQRGYIDLSRLNESADGLDLSALKIAGMSESSVRAALTGEV